MHMPYRLISPLMHLARVRVLAAAVAMGVAVASAGPDVSAADASAPPAFIHQALPDATLWGQGQMRFFGLRIYDARLWAGPQFEAADFGAHPLALELTYQRNFTAEAIAKRSIEEMRRVGSFTPQQATRWQQALAAVRNDYSLARLYAMGADAWSLANHFSQMRQVPGFELNGNTGDLTATQDCVINRKLSWLKYQGGQIVAAN